MLAACPECGAQEALHTSRVTDSDVLAVWCEFCNYEDGL